MVSFGVAPALIMYEWALKEMGQWGWIVAFIYCACAALRLARFNTNINVIDKRFFQGLPSPAAAALIAGLVWVMLDFQIQGTDIKWLALSVTLFAGLTMVSNIPFYSGKEINLKRRVPFVTVLLIVLFFFVLIPSHPPVVLFILFAGYALSGYLIKLWRFNKNRKRSESNSPS
jgi:CDP-diacylglycerol--serine O-phosphatidyltransferase